MSTWKKTFEAVMSGHSDANIRFDDLCAMLLRMGYAIRQVGSHRIFTMSGRERLNLQPQGHKSKPYQVRQVREELQKYQ